MKNTLLVGVMLAAFAQVAAAQGADIHTRCGENGGHISIAADTQVFNYEATVSGTTVAFIGVLEVFHNGVLKSSNLQVVLLPPPSYVFDAPVNMSNWGLQAGDQVTFRFKVLKLGSGALLGCHTLIGDVTAANTGSATQ